MSEWDEVLIEDLLSLLSESDADMNHAQMVEAAEVVQRGISDSWAFYAEDIRGTLELDLVSDEDNPRDVLAFIVNLYGKDCVVVEDEDGNKSLAGFMPEQFIFH